MNKTFKDLAVSLAGIAMSLVLLPQTVFAGETTAEDFTIEKDDETQTCKITGYSGSSIKPDIPDTISGYKVTSIGGSAFKDAKVKITSVDIPKYVTSIDDKAFEDCDELVTVKFTGHKVNSIGAYAFNKCKALADITIPYSVTSIGEGSFMQCASLTSISIPSEIKDIPTNAFAYDTALSTVNLGSFVKTIGENAFALCPIDELTIPKSVESIGKKAFLNTGTMTITCLGAVKTIDDTAFDVDEDSEYYSIYFIADGNNPGDVTRFCRTNRAFAKYYYQLSADPEIMSVASINTTTSGTRVYNGDSYLAGETINVRIRTSEKYRLVKWAAESSKTVKFENEDLTISSFRMPAANVVLKPELVELFNVFFYSEDGSLLLYKDVFAKGDTVVYKGATPVKQEDNDYIYKFDHWTPELGTVTAESSYKAVFKAIPKITEIEPTYTPVPSPGITAEPTDTPVPTNTPAVTTAPAADPTATPAAQQNTGFVIKGKTAVFTKPAVVNATKVSIPATVKISGKTYKVTEIKDNAFKGNTSLTQVTIGKNVTKIGKGAFSGCRKLKKIIIKGKVTKIGKNAFKGIFKKAKFTLPKKQAKALKKLIKKAGFKI